MLNFKKHSIQQLRSNSSTKRQADKRKLKKQTVSRRGRHVKSEKFLPKLVNLQIYALTHTYLYIFELDNHMSSVLIAHPKSAQQI